MKNIIKKINVGFTMVELIVVISILTILSTVGFIEYSGYLESTRDTNRVSQISSIGKGLEIYKTKNSLPLPKDYVKIYASGDLISYQGYIGKQILEIIEYSGDGKDPKDKIYFSYLLSKNKKNYQLMAFLENVDNLQTFNIMRNKANAINYLERYPTVYGNKLGILTDLNNIPIQESPIVKSNGGLDIINTNNEYIARFKDDEDILQGTGLHLRVLEGIVKLGGNLTKARGKNCYDILNKYGILPNGIYTINPNNKNSFIVYCNMSVDGGGWTLVLKLNGDSDLFEYNSPFWLNEELYNNYSFDYLTKENVKLESYNTLQFSQILLQMKSLNNADDDIDSLIITYSGASMLDLIKNGGQINTNLGRNSWLSLIENINIQDNCNDEGINKDYGIYGKTRIGILFNNENNCSSIDSLIGFGNGGNHPWGNYSSVGGGTAGNFKNSLGWIFVR